MQSVSSRIWTRVTVFISYDDNHYTTGTQTSAGGLSLVPKWQQVPSGPLNSSQNSNLSQQCRDLYGFDSSFGLQYPVSILQDSSKYSSLI